MKSSQKKGSKRFGLVYADPNGIPNWKLLSMIFRNEWYDKIDLLINMPCTAIKKNMHNGATLLTDGLAQINKKTWTIRDPDLIPDNRWHWSFLLGMNSSKALEWKRFGFYPIDSDKGKAILYKLTHGGDYNGGFTQLNLF